MYHASVGLIFRNIGNPVSNNNCTVVDGLSTLYIIDVYHGNPAGTTEAISMCKWKFNVVKVIYLPFFRLKTGVFTTVNHLK